MIDARPCNCGALPRERIGDGFPMAICGISMGAPFGTYLYCPVCGERTNAFREPLEAYNAWNRKMDYLTHFPDLKEKQMKGAQNERTGNYSG